MPTQLSHQPCTLLGFKCGFVGCTGTWSNSNSHKLSAGGMLITADMASLAALKVLPIFCARSCKKETQATPTEQNNLDGTKWWKMMKNHEICFMLLTAPLCFRSQEDLCRSSSQQHYVLTAANGKVVLKPWTRLLDSKTSIHKHLDNVLHSDSPWSFTCVGPWVYISIPFQSVLFHIHSTRGTFYFWLRRKTSVSQKSVESNVPFGWELGDLRSCGEALSFCEDILVMTSHATMDFCVQNGKTQGFGNITWPEITI